MKKINFAIIGCGQISSKHIDAVQHSAHAQLVAVADTVMSRVQEVSKNSHVEGYTDYHQLLANPAVDVVNICTPSGLHAEIAIAAARAGKHVILEKPMALTTKDAKKIITAFKKAKITLSLMFQNRYNRAVQFVKEREKRLGKLNYITAQVYWYRNQNYYNNIWRGTRAMDGGVLTNQGSHYVDLVLYFKKKPITKISAFGATLGHKIESEDTITVNLTFDDGSIGNIQANTIAYPSNYEGSLTLFYDRATIKIGGTALNEIVYWKGDFENEIYKTQTKYAKNVYSDGHRKVIQNMTNYLLGLEPLFIPGNAGVGPVHLIENAYLSMKTGRVINLK